MSPQEPDNHQSVADNLEAAQLLLQTELDLGRMAGPFAQPPFDNFRVSPLKLVPKPKSSKSPFRLVHNLSHPFKGTQLTLLSLNGQKSVKYATIMDAIRVTPQILSRYGMNALPDAIPQDLLPSNYTPQCRRMQGPL